jgi:hypothetical protein
VRQIIRSAAFGKEQLAAAKNPDNAERDVVSVEDLTFGEYIRLLQVEANWEKVGLGIDRTEFCSLLDDVRIIRNGVMHFDPDGVVSDDLLKLRRMVTMLQRLGSIDGLQGAEPNQFPLSDESLQASLLMLGVSSGSSVSALVRELSGRKPSREARVRCRAGSRRHVSKYRRGQGGVEQIWRDRSRMTRPFLNSSDPRHGSEERANVEAANNVEVS